MKREISPFIRLNPKDNVVVARRDVPAGMAVESEGFTTRTEVPAGYKAAARDIRKGEPILSTTPASALQRRTPPPAP